LNAVLNYTWKADGSIEVKYDCVEECGGCSHDKADVVETFDAGFVRWQHSPSEVGPQVTQRRKAKKCGVPRTEEPWIKFDSVVSVLTSD